MDGLLVATARLGLFFSKPSLGHSLLVLPCLEPTTIKQLLMAIKRIT